MSDKKLQIQDLGDSFLFFAVINIGIAMYSWFNYSMMYFALVFALYMFSMYGIIITYITIRNHMFIRRNILRSLPQSRFPSADTFTVIQVEGRNMESFTEPPELIGEKKIDLDPVIFKINDYITLKLENGYTKIYINDEEFKQCKYLMLNILKEDIVFYDEVKSIDEAMSIDKTMKRLDGSLENDSIYDYRITPDQEFIAHCSNIQAWVENNYNTRILHSNLSFPLLKRLAEVGDEKAKVVFKENIVSRYIEGNQVVREYLKQERYLNYLSIDNILFLVREVLEKERKIDLSVRLNGFKCIQCENIFHEGGNFKSLEYMQLCKQCYLKSLTSEEEGDESHRFGIIENVPPNQDPVGGTNINLIDVVEEELKEELEALAKELEDE